MSFHPSLHLLNWDFVLSVSIKENEAAVDVTAFVSCSVCRWWWKHCLRSAEDTHARLNKQNLCSAHWDLNMYSPHIAMSRGHQTKTMGECAPLWRQEEELKTRQQDDWPTWPATTCFLIHVFMHHLDTRRPQGCKHRGVKGWVAVAPAIPVKERSRVFLLPRSCKLFLIKGSWRAALCRYIYIAVSAPAYKALTAAQIQ